MPEVTAEDGVVVDRRSVDILLLNLEARMWEYFKEERRRNIASLAFRQRMFEGRIEYLEKTNEEGRRCAACTCYDAADIANKSQRGRDAAAKAIAETTVPQTRGKTDAEEKRRNMITRSH